MNMNYMNNGIIGICVTNVCTHKTETTFNFVIITFFHNISFPDIILSNYNAFSKHFVTNIMFSNIVSIIFRSGHYVF